jgi:transposase
MRAPPEQDKQTLLPEAVAYHYAEGRAAEVPRVLFKDCHATIQTDAYAGYNPVFVPNHCVRLACMAHIRRKFIEAQGSAKTACAEVLKLIAALYHVESPLKAAAPEERRKARLKKAFPVLVRLYRLLRSLRRQTLPQADFSKALEYAWAQRSQMLHYLRDGRFEIDNNAMERQMRPIAVGRKNYLFAGSHDGARNAAVLYTLINTCKLNKVNPFEYLKDVLVRIHEPGTVQDLLPYNWKPRA